MNTNMNIDAVVTEIAELTDINDHTSAFMEVAKLVENASIYNRLATIRYNQDKVGYLATPDYVLRTELYNDLMIELNEKFSLADVKKVYSAL